VSKRFFRRLWPTDVNRARRAARPPGRRSFAPCGAAGERLEPRTLLAVAPASNFVGKWQESPGPLLREYTQPPVIELGWHDNIVGTTPFANVTAYDQQTGTDVVRDNVVKTTVGRNADYYSDTDSALLSGQTYQYKLTAKDDLPATPDADSQTISVTSWTTAGIGGAGGSGTSDGETVKVTGSGTGINTGTTSDSFRYVYRTLSGDGQIVAYASDFTGIGDQGGIMFREPTSVTSPAPANAKYLALVSGSGGSLSMYRRSSLGGVSDSPGLSAGSGSWIKLVRQGNRFTASASSDGVTWTQVWQDYLTLAPQLHVGMLIRAGGGGATRTVSFRNVSVTAAPGDALASGWAASALGGATGAGWKFDAATDSYSVEAAGAMGGTTDTFQLLSQPITATSGTVIARVASVGGSSVAASAGVMTRTFRTANASFASVGIRGDGQAVVRFRTAQSAAIAESLYPIAGSPRWVRLSRAHDSVAGTSVFTASVSTDGVNWTQLGSTPPVTMPGLVFSGLAADSAGSSLSTSRIESVSVTDNAQSPPANVSWDPNDGRSHKVRLSWDVLSGATGYVVERLVGASAVGHPESDWERVGVAGAAAELNTTRYGTNKIVFLDASAREQTTYTYRIRAVRNAATSSIPSYAAGITTGQMKEIYQPKNISYTPGTTATGPIKPATQLNVNSFFNTDPDPTDSDPAWISDDPTGPKAAAYIKNWGKARYNEGWRNIYFDYELFEFPKYNGSIVQHYLDLRSPALAPGGLAAAKTQVAATAAMLKQWIGWLHEGFALATPTPEPVSIGIYSTQFIPGPGDVQSDYEYKLWQAQQDFLRGYDVDSDGNRLNTYDSTHDLESDSPTWTGRDAFDYYSFDIYHQAPINGPFDLSPVPGHDWVVPDMNRHDIAFYQFVSTDWGKGFYGVTDLPREEWRADLAEVRRSSDGYIDFLVDDPAFEPVGAEGTLAAMRSASAAAIPAAPANVTLDPVGMHLSWTNSDPDVWAFVVERSIGSPKKFTAIGGGAATKLTFDDPYITPGTAYYYRVRAINKSGNTSVSPVVSAPAMRDASDVNLAYTFETQNAPFLRFGGQNSFGAQRNNWYNSPYYEVDNNFPGYWEGYKNVRFDGTENQFTLSHSVNLPPNQSVQVQIWVDAVPLTPGKSALASFTVQGNQTPNPYRQFLTTEHAITLPAGFAGNHDVYIYYSEPTTSTDLRMGWFQFSHNAAYTAEDRVSQGNWVGKIGAGGYVIADVAASLPTGITYSTAGASSWTWALDTPDVRAMKKPTAFSPDHRVASTFYAVDNQSFTVDVNVDTASQPGGRDVSLYFLDWDDNGRSQKVDVLDPTTGAVIDSRVVSGFRHGTYLTWHIAGNVRFRFTKLTGANPVLSGLFVNQQNVSKYDINLDGLQGSWNGAIGTSGYAVAGEYSASNPSSLGGNELSFEMDQIVPTVPLVNWADPTSDVRAPQKGSNPSTRVAKAWSFYPGYSFDVNITTNTLTPRYVSLYFVDFDRKGRSMRVEVLDPATDAVTSYYDVTNFGEGKYLTFQVAGSAKFRIVPTGGTADNNAVLSGVFFD
jgi:hypothetical protein